VSDTDKKYRVVHTTTYNFENRVTYCQGELRLIPQGAHTQKVTFSQTVFRPLPLKQWQQLDSFGNVVSYFEITRPLMSLSISAINTVEVQSVKQQKRFKDSAPLDDLIKLYSGLSGGIFAEIAPYLGNSPLIVLRSEFSEYAQLSFSPGLPVLAAVKDLVHRLHHDFIYDNSATHVGTNAWQAMQMRRGVCQDFAQVAIACLRSVGIAARYVTGYVVPPTAVLTEHHRDIGSGLSHAWFSVFEPKVGWVDFDPTNNCAMNDRYITISWGRDYSDVPPLSASIAAANPHSMQISIDIESL